MTDLDSLVRDLGHPGLPLEIGVLLGCLALAFAICWLIGRRQPPESVWFGRAVVDGLLFPLLALVFTYSATLVLASSQRVLLLKVAVPVLISLAGIRFLARVFTVVFPRSGLARLVERLFSWLAWIAAVLWIVGLLPAVMDEMEAIHFGLRQVQDQPAGHRAGRAVVRRRAGAGAVDLGGAGAQGAARRGAPTCRCARWRPAPSGPCCCWWACCWRCRRWASTSRRCRCWAARSGVGLGFGLQKLAANYVSGFVILFERSLRIGDTVRVDNFEGVVVDIKTRYTLIRSLSGRESIVPNEKLITERIENLSLADPRILLTTDVTVGYDSDVETGAAGAARGGARRRTRDRRAGAGGAAGATGRRWAGVHAAVLDRRPRGRAAECALRGQPARAAAACARPASTFPFPQRVVHLHPPESRGCFISDGSHRLSGEGRPVQAFC